MYFLPSYVEPKLSQAQFGSSSPPLYESVAIDPDVPRSQTNLFVRKLAASITEKVLQNIFEPFGTITSFALMRDIHTGESLGTAFVRYQNHEEAFRAMKTLNGADLYGRPISIQWAKKQHDGTPIGEDRKRIRKLFVRNIPMDVTSKQLRQLFSPHGAISNVTIHNDTVALPGTEGGHAPPQRNIAFILFYEDGAAEAAVRALHNAHPFESCEGIPLMVKLAEDNRQRLGRRQKYGNAQIGVVAPSPAPGNAATFGNISSADDINMALSSSVIQPVAPPYGSRLIHSPNALPNCMYAQATPNPYVLYPTQSSASAQLLPPPAVSTSSPPGSYLNALDYAAATSTSTYPSYFQAPVTFLCMGVDERGHPVVQQPGVVYTVPTSSQAQQQQQHPHDSVNNTAPIVASSTPVSQMSTPRVLTSSNEAHISNHLQLKLPNMPSLDTFAADPLINFHAGDSGDAIQSKSQSKLSDQNAAFPSSVVVSNEITSFNANKDYEELINLTKGFVNEHYAKDSITQSPQGMPITSIHDIFKPSFSISD
ncbi:unnamed protein product [Phytomonas sp. EM1]|nr:unnamed protein product [Phytomonas sp. EM1]|eukprot:CCW59645.1 unnamed protein product [Phytomonas sp. isolate EM1]